MKSPDWIIHCVFDDSFTDKNTETVTPYLNSHTHGLNQIYNHLDFQIVLWLETELIGYALNTMGNRVRNGEKFKDGDIITDLFEGLSVRLDEVEETDRRVLRIVIPDSNHKMPEDNECNPYFKGQLKKTDNLFK